MEEEEVQEVKADEDDDNDEYELRINMDDIVQILNPQGHQLSDPIINTSSMKPFSDLSFEDHSHKFQFKIGDLHLHHWLQDYYHQLKFNPDLRFLLEIYHYIRQKRIYSEHFWRVFKFLIVKEEPVVVGFSGNFNCK